MNSNPLSNLVEEHKEELLSLLTKLVSFQTESPPARNTLPAQKFIADYLKDLGADVDMWEIYHNDFNVVGTKKGSNSNEYRSLILNGHIDVAAIEDKELWDTPPFEATINNNSIFGRGVADMKGGLAACLFCLSLLKKEGFELKGDVILQSVIGEEVGEAGTKECINRGYSGDFAIVADTSECQIQGQGGVITGWVTIESPTTHHDGTRSKMIHAGGGLFAANAIEKMTKMINGLQDLERHWAVTKSYPGFLPGSNTINPAVIEGGIHPAFTPNQCALWITVHFYPNESYESVTQEIEEHLMAVASSDPWLRKNPPAFRWGGNSMIEDRGEIFPALEVSPNWQGVQLLQETHKQVFNKDVNVSMSPSVTDGGWLSEANIKTVIYGPGKLEQAHSLNEELSIDELFDYCKSLIQFIYQWCNLPKEEI
ncbi:acetylornithine deacetylase [Alkalihalobacillus trypoxylicola]|uniref:Acetylornithine deacetylase n=1 Tax=Alkalihalobacillus trypoxylicola TaxID=519424 RepID=A0A161PFQ7_9BACI|nr:acetylornithine deacetylase [Alkalihalobacillus trypoxylicola]KYG31987.1 acetylornithine deacetylase [Alkalihalobacillus trypoxylicola]